MFGFALVKGKITSNAKMKIYAEIGSPYLFSLSNLKDGVVLPSLVTHDSGFLIKIFLHFINSLPNPIFFKDTYFQFNPLVPCVHEMVTHT